MKAYILSDGEHETETLARLDALVQKVLARQGLEIVKKRIAPGELHYCQGCFGCWIKTPGECVIRDSMADINRAAIGSDVVVYLVPLVFGQYSANMKNAIDRWIPNILPFFNTGSNGNTTHLPRYRNNPQYIMIGYGGGLTAEDAALFRRITENHRRNGAVLVYTGNDRETEQALLDVNLQKAGAVL